MKREDPRRDRERAAFPYTLRGAKSFEGGIHVKLTDRKYAILALSALAALTLATAACAHPGPGFHGGPPPFGYGSGGPGFRPAPPPPRRDWRPAPPPPPHRDWRPAPPPPPRRDWRPAPPPLRWHDSGYGCPPPPRRWRHHRDRDDFLFLFPFLFAIAAGSD